MKRTLLAAVALLSACVSYAQIAQAGKTETTPYIPPVEEDVRANIADWQDRKFGLFIHWGTYSVLGVIESWSLCPLDIGWTTRARRERGMGYDEYVRFYESMKFVFNPIEFDPSKWAAAARYAGMKYVVFTTKHHDGFSMFDTKQNDYKITSGYCPFHTSPKANIAKEIFNAFREQGIAPGAYFSIADWHHDDYWCKMLPPSDQFINYDPQKHPEKVARFNDFVAAQLDELTSGEYGDLSMLWFDVATFTRDRSVSVDWERFAKVIRGNQPGTMMVARGQKNIYENYRTPEQEVPDEPLDYPWESCITMTSSWSWRPNLSYKSVHEILSILVKVVSRGGNLLLNVGPRADGTLDPEAYDRLKGIGDWMQVNSEGIYASKPYAPYQDGNIYYTSVGDSVYAYYISPEEGGELPAQISLKGIVPAKGSAVRMLGSKTALRYKVAQDGVTVSVPESLRHGRQGIWCIKVNL